MIFNSIALLFLLIGTGYYFALKGLFNSETNTIFSKVVLNISVPSTIILGLTDKFTRGELIEAGNWILLAFTIKTVFLIIGILLSRGGIFKKKTIFQLSFMYSNSLFIGLPVCITLFGEESIPYVFIYYLANTTFFWTYGVWVLRGGGSLKDSLQKLVTPPLMAFLVATLMIAFNIKLPAVITTYLGYLGGMTTPLSLCFVGVSIYNLGMKSLKPDNEGTIILAFRFLVAPAIAIFIITIWGRYFELPLLLKKVFFAQAAMPLMTNIAILCGYYKKEANYASKLVGLSTVMTIVTVPLFAFLSGVLF